MNGFKDMKKEFFAKLIFFGSSLSLCSQIEQTTTIPSDFRQHNLTIFNKSLLNPVFSYLDSERQQIAVWSRFQWTGLELPPTSIFANYNRRVEEHNGIGIGVFQHDFSIFTTNGLLLNYARIFYLNRETSLTIGVNVIPTQRTIDRNNFSVEEFTMIPETLLEDSYLVTVAPGINFSYKRFNIGVALENLLDYNLTQSDSETSFSDKIFLTHASYDFFIKSPYVILENAELRINSYFKTTPTIDNQVGVNLLLRSGAGWLQAGYDSFYGPSIGVGVKLFETLSIGGLLEFSGNNAIDNTIGLDLGPTFELIAAWGFLVNNTSRRRKSFSGPVKKKKRKEIFKKTETSSNINTKIVETITEEEFKEKNKEGNKYSLLKEVEDIAPGFYLIVNVYRTKKYFNAFIEKLTKDGLSPKSFFNEKNNYRYVYLKRYDLLKDSEAARDSKYNNKYTDETWILWVKKNE